MGVGGGGGWEGGKRELSEEFPRVRAGRKVNKKVEYAG